MGIDFNADDIFKIAEQIERNGARFYRRAAEKCQEQPAKKLLLRLAEMEDDHIGVFSAMRDELTGPEKTQTVFDPTGEEILYLQAMAGGHVFSTADDPPDILAGDGTMEDILKTAIGFEKDSIAFYLGILKLVPQAAGKDKIDNIIDEEMAHVAMLSKSLAELDEPGGR